jgi:spire-like protein
MNIHEILKNFRAPLSEEQAWAVCYQCAGELISKQEESFQHLQPQFIDVSLETTRIRKDGSIEFTTVSSERPPQKTGDVLFRLGSLVYECLDYGMETFMERELDPSLEKLILDMTCEQGDEGISVPEDFERKNAGTKDTSLLRRERRFSLKGDCGKEINLEMVLQKCTDHLTEDISAPPGHFKAVSRALVSEALELSEFLRQLYNGRALMSQSWGQGTGLTNWAYLQSLHASEWAKLWLQAMRELREGVTLRHVVHAKLPAASYELPPFEMLLDDIRYHRFQLNHVSVTTQRRKEDAHDIILDFIRSRPPLSKTTNRKMNPKPKVSPNMHEKLLNEICRGRQLRKTPEPTLRTVREIYFQELSPLSPEGSPYVTPKRKCLKPEIQLAESISRWDSPSPV